jgi:prefoldin subunit 5
MSDVTDVELDYYRERIRELEAERDQLRAALDELETEIRRGDNDNGNVDTNHCLAVIDNVEPLK